MATYRKAETFGDHVRLSAPTKGTPYWRLRTDDGEVDRKIPDEAVARAEAEQLRVIYDGKDAAAVVKRRFAPYRELLDASLDPTNRTGWGDTNAYELARLAHKWIRPVLDDTRCADIDKDAYLEVFKRMRAQHAYGSMDRVRRLLSTTHLYGVEGDWLPAKPFPVGTSQISTPKTIARTSGQAKEYIPEDQRPDTARVERLVEALEQIEWWRGLQGELAAWVGPRLGETFALRTCHIDTNPKKRQIAINWQYIETRTPVTPNQQKWLDANPDKLLWLPGKADHALWAKAPGVLLKRPKNDKVRETVYPGSMAVKIEKRLAEVAGKPSPPCPEDDCYDPDCALLFPASDGKPHRRSNFGRDVARKAYQMTRTDEDPLLRWPKTKTGKWRWHWHHLRHRAAGYHLDVLKLATADTAVLLGHSEDMLLKKYYHSSGGVTERAAAATKNR